MQYVFSYDIIIKRNGNAQLAQQVEQSAVNRSVAGSSPAVGAIFFGPLEKRLNSHPFHGCIHGFESHTDHQIA